MKYFRYIPLIIATVILFYITIISEGILDTGDGVQHYLIAKWSWKHPDLLLDHWGKPLFTLLSSLFAQFGFKGMMVFNCFLYVISALFSIKIVQKLTNSQSVFIWWVTPFLLLSAPIYTEMILSGMTEVLFATLTLAGIYFLLYSKPVLSAVIVSFLPFSRPEYGAIVPLFLVTYLLLKQYKAIPFLFSAFLLYGIWGYFLSDDFLWFIHQHTYTGSANFYGHGEWYHFLKHYPDIIGKLPGRLFLVATIGNIFYFIKNKPLFSAKNIVFFILILGGFSSVVFVHSYIWWKGINSSLGLIRVMATITPLIVVYIITGVETGIRLLPQFFKHQKTLLHYLFLIITLFSFKTALKAHYFPIKFSSEVDQTVIKAAEFSKQYLTDKNIVSYQYPLYAYGLGIDIFDNQRAFPLYSLDKQKPSSSLKNGDLIMWDAHFGPNESQLPLEVMLNDSNLKLIKTFFPKNRIKVLGDNDFAVFLFEITKQSVKKETDTLTKQFSINASDKEFPFVERFIVNKPGNQLSILFASWEFEQKMPPNVFFVTVIKTTDGQVLYYASIPLEQQGKDMILLPAMTENTMLEFQVYNPEKQQLPSGKLFIELKSYYQH